MKFTVKIIEISSTLVEVEANDEWEAKELVENDYWKNPSDYFLEPFETEFEID